MTIENVCFSIFNLSNQTIASNVMSKYDFAASRGVQFVPVLNLWNLEQMSDAN